MLTTPLKVFASIQREISESPENTQRLLVKREPSSPPTLIVQNARNGYNTEDTTEDTIESEAQFVYSDCQYTTSDRLLYIEQLERLVNSTIQGYSSAGVFINSRGAVYDGVQANMMNNVLHLLCYRLAKENTQRRNTQQRQINLEYGYLGFCDDACFDYRSDRVFRNFDATQTPLSTLIEPIHIDTVIGTIVSKPRRLPSLLVFHLSDGYQFDSTFAWIDLHPPMSQFGQHSYSKSYREFESLLKSLSIPSYAGALNTYQYSMSHMLVDFFSGSYQTMIFAHLEEYGHYTTESDLDVLEYASRLQNIRCCVTCGRKNNVQGTFKNQNQVLELQDEIRKQGFLLEKYKSANMADNQEISRLNNNASSSDDHEHDSLRKRLITLKNSAHASMERQNATTNIQIADMKHQIDDLKIELVKANMIANSFRCNAGDLEIYVEELQGINQELSRIHDADTTRMEGLQAVVTRLKRSENGDLMDDSGRDWLICEGQYIQELHELKSDKQRLTKEIDILTLERKRLISRNDSIRLEMDTKIARLDQTHDMELKSLADSLHQRLEQTLAEKDEEIALIRDDLEFARSQLQSALLENSTKQQQQTQTTRSPSPLQPKAEPKTSPPATEEPLHVEPSSTQNQTQNQPTSTVYIDLSSPPTKLTSSFSPITTQASTPGPEPVQQPMPTLEPTSAPTSMTATTPTTTAHPLQSSKMATTSISGISPTQSPSQPPFQPPFQPPSQSPSQSPSQPPAQAPSQPATLAPTIPSTQAKVPVIVLDLRPPQPPSNKKRRRLRREVYDKD